jgi:SRSO17 transposase
MWSIFAPALTAARFNHAEPLFNSVIQRFAKAPGGYRLYLPEVWANDKERRKEAGVPKEVSFQTWPETALGQIRSRVSEDVPGDVVLAAAAYSITSMCLRTIPTSPTNFSLRATSPPH